MKKDSVWNGFWRVILIMTLGAFFGMLSSSFFRASDSSLSKMLTDFQVFVVKNAISIFYIIFTIFIILTLIFYFIGKNEIKNSRDKDDSIVNDKLLSVGIMIPNLGLLLFASLFGAIDLHIRTYKEFTLSGGLTLVVTLLFYLLFLVVMQKSMVENIKKLYPEKKGNIYSINFQKEWEKSLDEREKIGLYYTGYKTYKALEKILLALFLITTIVFGTGGVSTSIYPSMLMALILILSNIVYLYYSIKSDNLV